MQRTYKLAKGYDYCQEAFGPMMTLDKAQHYQREMESAGFPVLVVNVAEGLDGGRIGNRLTDRKERLTK